MTKHLQIEDNVPVVRLQGGINTALPITTTSSVSAATTTATTSNVTTANITTLNVTTVSSAPSVTGVLTPTGGVAAAGGFTAPTVFHTGNLQPTAAAAATSGATNASVVTTETYVAEVFVPVNATLTGVSVLNGTAVAGNLHVGLADSTGLVVAQSATNVAASGTTAYQQVPFTGTYAAKGPAKYFVLLQGSNTGGRYIAHTIGNFGATKVTGETYGTFLTTAAYSTTTFTTAIGPVADVY